MDSQLERSLANPNQFTLTFELVPGPGGKTRAIDRILEMASGIAADGRFQAVSITENAGGHPALSPEVLGQEIRAMGLDVIIHFSCKDKNRNQMESMLFSWDRQHLHNLLVIAGDYPREGYRGSAKPVFDLETIHVLDMLRKMNQGIPGGKPHSAVAINPTSFLKGVAASPFKLLEAELVPQYYKLHRKIAAGADYVITQVGYDARKFHELLQYIRLNHLDIPVLGNVFIPSLPVVELMYRGSIPGCVIPESLYEQIQWEARTDDKGRKARLVRAARLLAVLQGIGYAGAHLGGPGLTLDDLTFVLDTAAGMTANWQEHVSELAYWPRDAWYYYQPDLQTGLNSTVAREHAPGSRFTPAYSIARLLHDLAFEPDGLLFPLMKKTCLALADGRLEGILSRVEHTLKVAMFGCQNCGDCTVAELAFLCPQAGCAKYLLNGPCGGSRNGWCEVYPGRKRCLYVKVYERLKAHGLEQSMGRGFVPPRNWELNNCSSWVNFFQGRDHTGDTR